MNKTIVGTLKKIYELKYFNDGKIVKRRFHVHAPDEADPNMFFTCFQNVRILEPFLNADGELAEQCEVILTFRESGNQFNDLYANKISKVMTSEEKAKQIYQQEYEHTLQLKTENEIRQKARNDARKKMGESTASPNVNKRNPYNDMLKPDWKTNAGKQE
jgi:hypothetical protein